MCTDLTEAEVKVAQRYIAAVRRKARLWVYMRWVIVAVGLLVVGVSAWAFVNMVRAEETGKAISAKVDGELSSELVWRYAHARVELLRIEMKMAAYGVMFGAGGMLLVIIALLTWNQHRRLAVLAKVLARTIGAAA